MKKVIVFFLIFGILLGTAACSGGGSAETAPTTNFPADRSTESNPVYEFETTVKEEEPSLGKYEDQYDLWEEDDYLEFYGSIDDILLNGAFESIYANGILYNLSYSNWEPYWQKWPIGEGLEILSFDASVLVAKKEDGSLWAFGYDGEDENGEMSLCSMQLDCSEEDYVYGYHPVASGEFACVYLDENGACRYKRYDLIAGEVVADYPLLCELDDELYPVKQLYNFGSTYCIILTDNTFCTSGTSISYEDQGALLDDNTRKERENVDVYYGWDSLMKDCISFADDDTSLYFYDEIMDWEAKQSHEELVRIPMPDGYTLDDISTFSLENDILITFSDGAVYCLDSSAVNNAVNGDVLPLEKVEGLDELMASGSVVKLFKNSSYLVALMDDGCLYRVCFV